MILLLVYYSSCQIQFSRLYGSYTFYLLPLDVVEIYVDKETITFLGKMEDKDDLLLQVTGDNLVEDFDSSKGLAGIYFKNGHKLKFINEGAHEIRIDVWFHDELPEFLCKNYLYESYPICDLGLTGELSDYEEKHFIYYLDHKGKKVSFGIILTALILMTIFTCCLYRSE